MTNRERIIDVLKHRPGLDDDELSLRTGVWPRQQINQICRRLEAEGVLWRVRGPDGKIVNVLKGGVGPFRPVPRPAVAKIPRESTEVRKSIAVDEKAFHLEDPMRTLFIIPCSGRKTSGGTAARAHSIVEDIPPELVSRLQQARARMVPRIALNEAALRPAWQRYEGSLYRVAGPAIGQALSMGHHILIISGGYGIVEAGEAIGTYEAWFHLAQWPRGLLQDVILAYADHHRLTAVRAFASASTDYSRLIRNHLAWRNVGISDAWLISPERSAGAMAKAPTAQGEALVAMLTSRLAPDWRSSHGLQLEAVSLL